MFKTLKNAWGIADLKKKILFTLLIVVLYRLGASIPVPFVDAAVLAQSDAFTGTILQYLNIISGEALAKATLLALGVSPYITASIVVQLLTVAIPALERWSKEGEEGKKKINVLTRIITIVLALVTSIGYTMFLKQGDIYNGSYLSVETPNFFHYMVIVLCYCAGAALVMWMAEKINESGIGNGISIILFANIIASTAAGVVSIASYAISDAWRFVLVEVIGFFAIAAIAFVVFITNSERRLPVQYAKKVVGRKMYGGQSTNLPIKLNMSGVMPIIFANSIVALPSTIELLFQNIIKKDGFWDKFFGIFAYDKPLYAILFFILIIAFSYFYILISFNPIEVANNLKKNGGFIPGYRPGKPTSDFITKVLNRITLIGALFLGVIAVVPLIVNIISKTSLGSLAFGGSSLLIVVGVILETTREIEAQITMRHYKGFLE